MTEAKEKELNERPGLPVQRVVGPTKVCTYDNPSTMARECWQDGKLLCHYSASLLESKPSSSERQPIPGRYLFFGANIGPWKAGQHYGSIDAMKPNARVEGRPTAAKDES